MEHCHLHYNQLFKQERHKLYFYVVDFDDLAFPGDNISKWIQFIGDYKWYFWNTCLYHKDIGRFSIVRGIQLEVVSHESFSLDEILNIIISTDRENKLKRILNVPDRENIKR